MSEWYMYLGWILGIMATTMMIAIIFVRPPPRGETTQYTIVYQFDGKVYLLPVFSDNYLAAEEMLHLYEQTENDNCYPDLHIYQYDYIGSIRGHHKWLK